MESNMKTPLNDAVRTVGQLLKHRPTTGAYARDRHGIAVVDNYDKAETFCLIGAMQHVAYKMLTGETEASRFMNLHDQISRVLSPYLINPCRAATDDWDNATPNTQKSM